MKGQLHGWIYDLNVDDDGHLTVGLNHVDGSKVIQVEEDVTSNGREWGDRFTTERIEKDYLLSLDPPDPPNPPEEDEHIAIRGYN